MMDLRFKDETGFVKLGIPGSDSAPSLSRFYLCVSVSKPGAHLPREPPGGTNLTVNLILQG